jgi:hypothetical protein
VNQKLPFRLEIDEGEIECFESLVTKAECTLKTTLTN